jgi:hypothetical protein
VISFRGLGYLELVHKNESDVGSFLKEKNLEYFKNVTQDCLLIVKNRQSGLSKSQSNCDILKSYYRNFKTLEERRHCELPDKALEAPEMVVERPVEAVEKPSEEVEQPIKAVERPKDRVELPGKTL